MRGRRAGGGPGERIGCDQIEPLLEAYHDGASSEADALAVRGHLGECERCAARLSAFDQVDHLLREAQQPAPPHELRSRLHARIVAQTHEQSFGAPEQAHDAGRRSVSGWWRAADAPAQAHGPRRISVAAGALSALTVAALLVLMFTRLPGPGLRRGGTSTASRADRFASQVIASLARLPRFDDWRAAYLGTDRQIHIVSADGVRAVTAPGLPNDALLTAAVPAPYANVATSPDGSSVAYVSGSGIFQQGVGTVPDGPVTVIDLRTGSTNSFDVNTTASYWSPDGSRLAALSADPTVPALYLLQAHGGSVTAITPTYNGQAARLNRLIGWTDSMHVLGVFTPSSVPGSQGFVPAVGGRPLTRPLAKTFSGGLSMVGLGIVDVTSGQVALLDNLPLEPETFLSPDGKLLFIPTSWWNDTAMVVDTATGQIRQLPAIGRAFAGKLQRLQTSVDAPNANWSMHAAWLPGASYEMALSLAVGGPSTTGSELSQPSGVWLLDLTGDKATQVTSRTYPLAWVPGTSTLLTADPPIPGTDGAYPAEGAGIGPTLYALASPQFGGTQEAPIAGSMLAYLGLVRTV